MLAYFVLINIEGLNVLYVKFAQIMFISFFGPEK